MGKINHSSTEARKNDYSKRGFYLRAENQFWLGNPIYSKETQDRLSELVQTFYHPNTMHLNLLKQ